MTYKNWFGNVIYKAVKLHTPDTIEQLQEIIHSATHVKAVGSRHSFNRVADTLDTLISLENLNQPVELNTKAMTVTVEGGMIYSQLGKYLHEKGYALQNLASLPHMSVVGAVATGTHGSGDQNGNLATAVAAIEFVSANGDLVTLSREDDDFYGAVVSMGGIGIISKITLDIVPTYDMQQYSYKNLPMPQLYEHFNNIMSAAYSVSLWNKWEHDFSPGMFLKYRIENDTLHEAPDEFFGAQLELEKDFPGGTATPRLGIRGPWYMRLTHFMPDMKLAGPVSEELQAEYFVPREDALEAIKRIQIIGDQITPLMGITELRSMTADNHWMSPSYGRDSIAIHFNMRPDEDAVYQLLPKIEEKIIPLGARPHWGKLFTLSPEYVQAQYDKLDDFRALLQKYDPNGKFRNDFLNRNIFS